MNWEIYEEKKGKTHYLKVNPSSEEVIAWETTGHWKSETGGKTSFKKFLNGDWDSWIVEFFGTDILEEAKEIVKGSAEK